MLNVTVRDDPTSEELRNRHVAEIINNMIQTGKLHQYGHVEKKDENGCLKCGKQFDMESRVPVHRLKTQDQVLWKEFKCKRHGTQVVHKWMTLWAVIS